MSAVELVQPDAALDQADDPNSVLDRLLAQSVSLLDQAIDLETALNAKGYAVTIKTAVAQRDLGKHAELSAAEVVRRWERRIGQLVREAQDRGEVLTDHEARVLGGKARHKLDADAIQHKARALDYFTESNERRDAFALADDVADDQFEQALAEAKEEGNLSRANVIRKVKGESAPRSERHELLYRTRRIDPNRVVQSTVDLAATLSTGSELIDYDAVDPALIGEWVSSLSESIRFLTTLKNNLKKKELTQ